MPTSSSATYHLSVVADQRISVAFPLTSDQATIMRHRGYLRSSSDSILGANSDVEAVRAWLAEFADEPYSNHTLIAARREIERFVLWAAVEASKPISDIRREDVHAYRLFLTDPQPRSFWCGSRQPRTSKDWRPFRGPLKDTSIDQAVTILKGFYDYLVSMRYLTANPVRVAGRRRSTRATEQHDVKRLITDTMWSGIVSYIETRPRDTKQARLHYERSRFVLMFSYLLATRVADFPNHRMGDLEFASVGENLSSGGWWWRARGKGDKLVMLPVNDQALAVLRRWRHANGLSPLPAPEEDWPLLGGVRQPDRPVSANMVYRIIKDAMNGAAVMMENDEPKTAARLKQASPHWLRHTALSKMVEVMPLSVVRDLGRHSDLKTTNRYVHTGDAALHAAAQKHGVAWGADIIR